jgi:polyhydroxyalkanoate synthesis regulator phasin
MMTCTRHEDAEKVWDELGIVRFAAKLQGETIGEVTLTVNREWTEDAETYRYLIEDDDSANECDEFEEARSIVADMLRTARNTAQDEREEQDNESARDFVEALIDDGRAADVLRALRAANLI